jgi:ribulose-5-phosphate 4-epimerase/fuculose-1-phosphate aldolase
MEKQEGVIKYRLEFDPGPPPREDLRELIVCRAILHGLGMIGQEPDRYGGYGFGNLSQRSGADGFVISASQTGHLPELAPEHFTRVLEVDIEANRVHATGPLPPSSEALTHAMIYRLDRGIRAVLHVHEPGLWRHGLVARLPQTGRDIAYGTPQMAQAVRRLFGQEDLRHRRILVMAGHEDGVIAFGASVDQALGVLLRHWIEARDQSL